jgi:hypothetical protein
MNEKLKVGDKYLSIKLVGHDYVNAFKNKDKKNSKEPDYRGDGVAVWISTKKEGSVRVSEENIL